MKMTKCTERGCRSLKTTCQDCGRTISTAELENLYSADVVIEKMAEMEESLLAILEDISLHSTDCVIKRIDILENSFGIEFLKIQRTLEYCEDDLKRLNSKMTEMKGSMEYKKRP
jgi:hypothetical protein